MRTLVFENTEDLDLAHSFECGQCFRWNRLDSRTGNGSVQVTDARTESDSYIGVVGEYACRATLDCGTLTLEVSGGDELFWRNYFDLDTDYSLIKARLIEAEPRIAAAIESGYGIHILRQDCYETLISFIISQNNNIPRIKKCIEGLCEKFGHVIGGGALYSFPTPEALAQATPADLAALKLGYRDKYIIEASKRFLREGEPCKDTISSYLGVGPKVASCIKLFGMGCVDAFPIDVWVKKIMADMYGFEESDIKGMQRFAAEKFGELGGYAQQYLFNYYRNVKAL